MNHAVWLIPPALIAGLASLNFLPIEQLLGPVPEYVPAATPQVDAAAEEPATPPAADAVPQASPSAIGASNRQAHLEMLMLDSLGDCLAKFDKFGDDPKARATCQEIAVQEAQNRYIRGE